MTRSEQREITKHVRTITAQLVREAMENGRYHDELEKRLEATLRCGSELTACASDACKAEAMHALGRTFEKASTRVAS